jgi:hypothetical protein
MRNLFLVLLLANLLVLGWQVWLVPGEVPAARLATPGTEAELTLTAADRGDSGPGAGPTGPGGPCLRIGPISDGQAADRVSERLRREGASVSQNAEEGEIWVGHWVQLENVGSRAEADRMVSRLNAGGLPDAYVLQDSPPFSISLGVFRSRERAEKVAAEARRLGFKPLMGDRYRPGVQYWLSVSALPGRLNLNELARESGQILRSESVPCERR